MPYAHISHAPHSTLEDYRAVDEAMGGRRSDGLLLTLLGAGADGLFVVDLWTSKAHADRFAAERLLPAMTRTSCGPDATATYSAFDTAEVIVGDGFLRVREEGGS